MIPKLLSILMSVFSPADDAELVRDRCQTAHRGIDRVSTYDVDANFQEFHEEPQKGIRVIDRGHRRDEDEDSNFFVVFDLVGE